MGGDALPRLREIRAQGPGHLRAKALTMLVDLAGAESLGERDKDAVDRLVRIKLLSELPVKVPSEAGRWLALPAERFDDALSVLELHDLKAVTTVMGVAAATKATGSISFQSAKGEKRTAYRVFITPEFENWLTGARWRLLWGNSFLDELDGFILAGKISERCGEAHFYVIDPYNGSESWYVARDGRSVRGYSTYAHPQFSGEPLPFEIERREDSMDDEEEAALYAEGVPETLTAADSLSAEPGPMLADHTHGHGWLATTHADCPNSRFPGALPI
ncbi:hypothetical protein GUY60_20180 [Streptomyces sp. YC537]|uniref:Uncharacterized protein n=1 Tax=Streptomyces boluensis TaxID=1775135 RepID=A0A964XLU2_9ACTN|nr:hypothetical protein [Streptomyces boluensis]